MKLALGTAQFGMDYGVSNRRGKTPLSEVVSILQYANENGIDTLDTAYSYGDSEEVLGIALSRQEYNFKIITKTPVFSKNRISLEDAETLKVSFLNSLKKLKQPYIEGLLIHKADDLLTEGGDILFSELKNLQYNGYIKKIGISVYTEYQIDRLMEKFTFDIIQLPINVLNQCLIKSACLARLKEKGIEIWARSVFLQGLLMMDLESIHQFFDPIKPHLGNYRKFLDSYGLTPVEGALSFIKNIHEIDYVVVGINNLEQLKTNLESFNKSYLNLSFEEFQGFSLDNPVYLDPGQWTI